MSRLKRFELNKAGVGALLKAKETGDLVKGYADSIRATAGAGYASVSVTSRDRRNAVVYAETEEAQRDNMEHNVLLKALGG